MVVGGKDPRKEYPENAEFRLRPNILSVGKPSNQSNGQDRKESGALGWF